MQDDHRETTAATERSQKEGADSADAERERIFIDGETPVSLSVSLEVASEQFEARTRTIGFECASGDWLESEWTGLSVSSVLEAATPPPETTHVLVEAVDGYRACIAVSDLVEAMIAYDAVDRPDSDFPRFVSPSIGGPRAVKNLAAIRPVELEPHEDPQDYEELYFEDM